MNWLLTGSGRCGTGYVSKLLTSAGLPCEHEGVFNLNGPGYARGQMHRFEADASWLAMPWLGEDWLKDVGVVHLVRNPAHVIRSFLRMGFWTRPQSQRYRDYQVRHFPGVVAYENQADRIAYWLTTANRIAGEHAEYRHRVEDDPSGLLEFIGIEPNGQKLFNNQAYNSRVYRDVDFDLGMVSKPLRGQVERQMADYGY